MDAFSEHASRRLQTSASQLTKDELRIAAQAELDLGVGYPEFSLPAWLGELWYDLPLRELTWRYLDSTPEVEFVSGQSLPRSNELARQLSQAMLQFLELDPSLAPNTFVTYSGSHALERSFATLVEPGCVAITTSPSIDIITAMLRERGEVQVRHVESDPSANFAVDVERLCSAVTGNKSVMVLTSPENPTGYVLSAYQLEQVSQACVESATPLVLDQCFCKVAPSGKKVALLPNVAPRDLSYLFVWDTGKTFDLDDDKVGFIVCSDDLVGRLGERLSILQCALPKRLLMLMKLIIDGAVSHRYGDVLTDIVADNLGEVIGSMAGTGVRVLEPDSGGFALLDISGLGVTAQEFSDGLLADQKVGVVPATTFFHQGGQSSQRDRYVRVALLRDRDELRRAMHRVRGYTTRLNGLGGTIAT